MSVRGRPLGWRALWETGRLVTLIGSIGSVGLALGGLPGSVEARTRSEVDATLPNVSLWSLPPEAQTTYQAILTGGPFPYAKDGVVFGNRERSLPPERRGYYHEYTVRTPASRDRGARRIVCGGQPPTRPAVCYYTGDHYATFQQIAR